jgi:transcriptional regulator with XRE-family HTH domain
MSDGATTFAARLQAARWRAGLTQEGLARLAGMHPAAIGHYEAGSREANLDNLRTLAAALGCTTDYLCGVDDGQDD